MGKDIILIKVQSFKYSQYTYYNSCLGAPECSECNPGTNCESEINDLAKPCDVGYECSNSSNPRECLSGTSRVISETLPRVKIFREHDGTRLILFLPHRL